MSTETDKIQCKVVFLHENGSHEPNEGLLQMYTEYRNGFKFEFGVVQITTNSRAEERTPVYTPSDHIHLKNSRRNTCVLSTVWSERRRHLLTVGFHYWQTVSVVFNLTQL